MTSVGSVMRFIDCSTPAFRGISIIFVFPVLATTFPSVSGNDVKIINGTAASANLTMHQVSVRRKATDGYFFGAGHICGGSLISTTVVLSAAHCFLNEDGIVTKANTIVVVMGTLNRYERTNETLVVDVTHILLADSSFTWDIFKGDIAMLFLNVTVPEAHPTVQPISMNRQAVASGTMCQATGWGRTEEGYLSDILMTVDVPIIDFTVCSTQTDFPNGTMQDGMLCAGYIEHGERDACDGDSGGPLYCNGQLVGIISFGFDCGQPRLPGVYTNVSYYASWVDDELRAATSAVTSDHTRIPVAVFLTILCLKGII